MEWLYAIIGTVLVALILLIPVLLAILECKRWQKKGGKYWIGKYLLTVSLALAIPVLFALFEINMDFIPNSVWRFFDLQTGIVPIGIDVFVGLVINIVLPIIVYLLARKLIK